MKTKFPVFITMLVIMSFLAACQPSVATTTSAVPTNTQAEAVSEPTQTSSPTEAPQPTETTSAVTRPFVMLVGLGMSASEPADNWDWQAPAYLSLVYEGLFRPKGEKNPTIEPWLAAEVPSKENGGISADGLVYTIKLKPGIKFHDGSPLNAAAVIYSYERMKALKFGVSGVTANWIDKMEAPDDLTVKFTLSKPFADFLKSMSSVWGNLIVNPAITKAHEGKLADGSPDWGYTWLISEANEAGSGPYKLVSRDLTLKQLSLERDPNYWGGWQGDKHIEKMIIRWDVPSATARLLLEKGDADSAPNLAASDFVAIEKTSGIIATKYEDTMQYYLGFNNSSEQLKDIRVRQALLYSFNYDQVIKDIFLNNLSPMTTAVGPGYPEVYTPQTVYKYDLEKARSLLEEAGYSQAKPLELTINILPAFAEAQAVAEYWQNDLAQIGVNLKLVQTDWGTFGQSWWTDCSASTNPNMGQLTTFGIGGDYPSAWETIWQIYPKMPNVPCDTLYIDDPKVNKLFDDISLETDPAKREVLFKDLYEYLNEQAYALWIGQGKALAAYRDWVKGYEYTFAYSPYHAPLDQMWLEK